MFGDLLTSTDSSGEDERSFHLRLAFARYLPPDKRLGLLEQRRAVLGERLSQLARQARARRDDRYMRLLSERQQEALSGDVSWLDRLIDQERAGRATLSALVARPRLPARFVPLASASQLQRTTACASGPQVGAPR